MKFKFEKYYAVIKLIYEIKGKKIKIFDDYFVINNKSNCKMIVNNKMSEIKFEYEIANNKIKFLKVKLLMLKKRKLI